jgi:uncharacterized membrane protein
VSTSRNRSRSTGSQRSTHSAGQQQRREEKRAQFEAPRRRTGLHVAAALGALVVVALVTFVVVSGRGGGETATATVAAAPGADVTIPVASVNDGKAHFFTYDAGGTTVKYFVLSDGDGKVRAALDACEVCYPQRKGYQQEGDTMVCNNCGQVFPAKDINVITGGCNPIPLKRSVSGDTLTITVDSIEAGAQYF